MEFGDIEDIRTAAILPEAEIAPTVRLDCLRAFLNMATRLYEDVQKGTKNQLLNRSN